jgi:aminoglycoside phosphotransferase (APT) family kinase protein
VSQFAPRANAQHRTLSFAVSWREGRQPRVERLDVRRYATTWTRWAAAGEPGDGQHGGIKARREWAVMRWLYGAGLPVPAVYAQGDDFVLMAHVNGRNASLAAPHVVDLARTLAQLHRLNPPLDVRETLPRVEVDRELDRLAEIAARHDDRQLVEAIMELRTAFESREGLPPCVLCGEAIFDVARFDARGITALPNWDNSALGDPRWDVAHAIHWLRARQAGELADRFLAAYQDRAGYVLTGTEAWKALIAVQSWALTTWLREHEPEHPLASERKAWIESTWRTLTRLRHQDTTDNEQVKEMDI